MSPKSYRLIFASHGFIGSPSGFNKDNIGVHVGESACGEYQNFTARPATVAMAHGEVEDYRSTGRQKQWLEPPGKD